MSFKKSYQLSIDPQSETHLKQRINAGIDNPGFTSNDEPKLTQFIIQGLNGQKSKSTDYSKGWNIDDHQVPIETLFLRYGTHPDRGLTTEQISKNLASYGQNILFASKKSSEILKFLSCVLIGLNTLLWICGVFSIGAYLSQFTYMDKGDIVNDNLYSGLSLIIVVFVAGCFSYYQEFQSSKIMDSFKTLVPYFTVVWRDAKRIEVHVSSLVVGDIVEVKYGDRIPADIRILECHGFKVDNSTLTGESEPQRRSPNCTDANPMETQNLAFFSTSVIEGSAKGLVVRVGSGTFMGRLASLASELKPTDTPIAKEMRIIIAMMTIGSLVFGAIFFGIGLSMNYSMVDTLFLVIGIVVGNVCENLNVTLTIILALTARKMAKKHCLVKHLHAVETLGSASVICSDKTGTLTQNKMSVAHMWFDGNIAEADTSEFAQTRFKFGKDDPGFKALSNVAILCSRARFKPRQDSVPILKREIEGDASEAAILKCMELQFGNVTQMRFDCPKVCEIPFNSNNKFQVSVHDLKDSSDPRYFMVMKGAPEKILAMSTSILIGNVEFDMDDKWRKKVEHANLKLASLGERVLGFCDCRLPLKEFPPGFIFDSDNPVFLNHGLRFVGLISMIDPPRASVPLAVSKCRSAGIKVVMITGDHPITAKAIARSVGIISSGNQTIEEIAAKKNVSCDEVDPTLAKAAVVIGSELSALSSDELDSMLTFYEEIVFARTSPEQKFLIVEAFQRLGKVVAVTGDGVNDSPALKKADIGIAMGIAGTDVAKEVSDMILMDDNFATIVSGVEDGRQIFDNLKKLLRYTLADNVAEMYCYWVFVVLRVPLPMGTLAMLISTLAIDMGPAISLAHEGSESDIMKLAPRNPRKDTLVTQQTFSYAYGQVSIIETAAGFLAYFVTLGFHGWYPHHLLGIQPLWDSPAINDLQDSYEQEWTYTSRQNAGLEAQTAFFAAIVICQWINAISCKTRRLSIFQHGFKNHFMNFALLLSPCIACIFIYTPDLNLAVKFLPMRWESWIACFPFALVLFFYDELRRAIVRAFPGTWIYRELYL